MCTFTLANNSKPLETSSYELTPQGTCFRSSKVSGDAVGNDVGRDGQVQTRSHKVNGRIHLHSLEGRGEFKLAKSPAATHVRGQRRSLAPQRTPPDLRQRDASKEPRAEPQFGAPGVPAARVAPLARRRSREAPGVAGLVQRVRPDWNGPETSIVHVCGLI